MVAEVVPAPEAVPASAVVVETVASSPAAATEAHTPVRTLLVKGKRRLMGPLLGVGESGAEVRGEGRS
ncbi:hypothetical protein SVIO_022320 [Streptomyces violaceusniger]|uniref:Uncharacterized protein n=1 Tax=Streptomyces violaceusniger TaxID=68280 RepID=A0A4D4L0N9_STRVO|nr:hypothetical protein SVIO_022320 [Streptomyces violaceusniger]